MAAHKGDMQVQWPSNVCVSESVEAPCKSPEIKAMLRIAIVCYRPPAAEKAAMRTKARRHVIHELAAGFVIA